MPLYVAFIDLTERRGGLFKTLDMPGCLSTVQLGITKSFHDNVKGNITYDNNAISEKFEI